MEDFLNIEGLPRRLRKYVASMIKKMKRGKMIHLEHVKGKIIASVDGVETHRRSMSLEKFKEYVAAGLLDRHSQIAVHKDKSGVVESLDVYHRLVVICIITDRGPMPLSWGYQESDSNEKYAEWLSRGGLESEMPNQTETVSDKLKQEGEITTLKRLLAGLKTNFPRKMPFDVLIGDGLYDKAPVLCEVEKYGVALIAVHKGEHRDLRKEAVEDFSTCKPLRQWTENHKEYEGWMKVFEDKNIQRCSKKIRIVRVTRRSKNDLVDNYFYCSDKTWITPRLVEWCRYYRWKQENGFNAWANTWKLLKHVFHHTHNACDAMLGLIFISIIMVENFRHGNLRRGKTKKKLSLKLFFRELVKGIKLKTREDLEELCGYSGSEILVVT